jgi:hypothetical protein
MEYAAAFDTLKDPLAGRLTNDNIERIFTIVPPPLFFNTGANARHIESVPK